MKVTGFIWSTLLLLTGVLLISLTLFGCHNVKAPAIVPVHIQETLHQMVTHDSLCTTGNLDECSVTLAMAASELLYLTDPNTGVTYSSSAYQQRVSLLALQINRLSDRCTSGDDEACRQGGRLGRMALVTIFNGLTDSNTPVE